jgi:GAF domain-containing protein
MKARIPENESERLAALREYHILDTAGEQTYDDITTLAAYVCRVPIAMISLVDESRQWFKSRVGLSEQETPRDAAFCAHAILQSEPLIVRDALADARFSDSALVTRSPNIRFYAGFPLASPEGFALGTLCAIDRRPRLLSGRQKTAMQALSRQVMALLELRRVSGRMADALDKVKTLHGLLPICAWCKRIRDDRGYWSQVEAYLHEHTGADFTHGICPDCMEKNRPGKPQPKRGE